MYCASDRPRAPSPSAPLSLQCYHKDLPYSDVYAYGTSLETASVPGPTIEATRGIDTLVRRRHMGERVLSPLRASRVLASGGRLQWTSV